VTDMVKDLSDGRREGMGRRSREPLRLLVVVVLEEATSMARILSGTALTVKTAGSMQAALHLLMGTTTKRMTGTLEA